MLGKSKKNVEKFKDMEITDTTDNRRDMEKITCLIILVVVV